MKPATMMGAAPRRLPSDQYDVVVVGARVAGAATAMLLARCGHKVLMIDRAEMGLDTVSTHTILRLGVLQLSRWGLLDRLVDTGVPPIRRVTLGFGSEIVPIDLSDDFGVDTLYAPRRTVLDPILIGAAVEDGVEISTPTRMTDLVWNDDRVTGVVIDDGSGKREVRARYVIGADGVWSRTADRVTAKAYRWFPPTNAVYYAYYEGIGTDGLYFQFSTGAAAGLIPTNDDQMLVYVGWPADRVNEFRADPERAFFEQARAGHLTIGEAVLTGERVSEFRGTPGLPGFLRCPWGPGWALVGDAGYTKDPISAHGISDALRDAELCAREIDRSLRDPTGERGYLSRYQVARDRLSIAMLDQSARLGSYEWDEPEAATLMRGLSRAVKAECEAMVSLPAWPGATREVVLAG